MHTTHTVCTILADTTTVHGQSGVCDYLARHMLLLVSCTLVCLLFRVCVGRGCRPITGLHTLRELGDILLSCVDQHRHFCCCCAILCDCVCLGL